MTDWTGPDAYAAVLEVILVVAVAAAGVADIRWRARRVQTSIQPTHTRANTLAWFGLLLSVLLLIGAFVLSVKSSGQHGSFDRVRSSGLLVGVAYIATMAAAFTTGHTAASARRQHRTGSKPTNPRKP
jgi:uncharacterized membrane protein